MSGIKGLILRYRESIVVEKNNFKLFTCFHEINIKNDQSNIIFKKNCFAIEQNIDRIFTFKYNRSEKSLTFCFIEQRIIRNSSKKVNFILSIQQKNKRKEKRLEASLVFKVSSYPIAEAMKVVGSIWYTVPTSIEKLSKVKVSREALGNFLHLNFHET